MQTKEIVFRALQGLPAPLREALTLHDLEGVDYDEMSKILECSRASAKLRVFRARRALKERVEAMMKAR
jgi:RNA polymerase sigma-70 factor (ECF subfamily)